MGPIARKSGNLAKRLGKEAIEETPRPLARQLTRSTGSSAGGAAARMAEEELVTMSRKDLMNEAVSNPAAFRQHFEREGLTAKESQDLLRSVTSPTVLSESTQAKLRRGGYKVDNPIMEDAVKQPRFGRKKAMAGAAAVPAIVPEGEDDKPQRAPDFLVRDVEEENPQIAPVSTAKRLADVLLKQAKKTTGPTVNAAKKLMAQLQSEVTQTKQEQTPETKEAAKSFSFTGTGTGAAPIKATEEPAPVSAGTTSQSQEKEEPLSPQEQLALLHENIQAQKNLLMQTYKEEANTTRWLQAAEKVAHALARYGAAQAGLKSGQDLSDLKIEGTDWDSYLKQSKDLLDVGMKSLDAEYKMKADDLNTQIADLKRKEERAEDKEEKQQLAKERRKHEFDLKSLEHRHRMAQIGAQNAGRLSAVDRADRRERERIEAEDRKKQATIDKENRKQRQTELKAMDQLESMIAGGRDESDILEFIQKQPLPQGLAPIIAEKVREWDLPGEDLDAEMIKEINTYRAPFEVTITSPDGRVIKVPLTRKEFDDYRARAPKGTKFEY